MLRICVMLAAALWASVAVAADQPQYAPPPPWVKAVPIPAAAARPGGVAVQVLLLDKQTRFGPSGDEFYSETAFRVLTPAGLSLLSGLAPSWNPEIETLTFHRVNILRGGQVIDLLDGGKKVTVLRREKNLELAMLDGDLTATLQPEGLQVGDVLDIAFTLTSKDPVLQGNSQGFDAIPPLGAIDRVLIRAVWPDVKPIRWRATDGLPTPSVSRTGAETELTVDVSDFTAPKPPVGAPPRYQNLAQLQFTQFQDWASVSALMAPLYAKAETLAANSPLKAEAQKIRAAFPTQKQRAAAALRLVQDQLRYAFVGLNLGGYVPADADVTWRRRFGDCKGKTVVLLALLHDLGIEAAPALVSTGLGDGLDARLPALLFDHVIVRARIDGKIYWLDGTRSGDRALDDILTPDLHWVLPVQDAGAALERLTPAALAAPAFESLLRLDASAGVDAPAPAHAEALFRGDAAVTWDLGLTSLGHEEAQRSLRDYWRGRLPWIDINSVEFSFDDPARVLRMTMDGSATMHWTRNASIRDFDIPDSDLGYDASFKRDPGLHDDAPFAVDFPVFLKWTAVVVLPAKGVGFGLMNAGDLDQTIAGVRYQRQTRIVGGVTTMIASEQSLTPEFPASEASADAAALRTLSDFAVDIRQQTPQAPDAEAASGARNETPPPPTTDASSYSVSGAAFLEKSDYPHAIEDFSQAIKLDPTVSKYVYDRGVAYFENHQDDLALADFDQALRINPNDELALEARGQIELFRSDTAQAGKDFDAAARLSSGDAGVLRREAMAYDNAGIYEGEVAILDGLIARTPTAWFYNARCWARAESGRELPLALSDCDASLKLNPDAPATLDSRAFVELRLGRLDAAIKDYDAALALSPKQAASLYGRGLAELRQGARQAGEADIAAAEALAPKVGQIFARTGVKP